VGAAATAKGNPLGAAVSAGSGGGLSRGVLLVLVLLAITLLALGTYVVRRRAQHRA
jgi:hypothetical protein